MTTASGSNTKPPLPPGWRWVRLGEVCEQVGSPINPQDYPDETFAHYSIPAFDAGNGPAIEPGKAILSNKVLFPEGAILFSKLNPRIPRVWHVQDKHLYRRVCSTEFLPLMPDGCNLNAEFLTLCLQDPRLIETLRARVAAATKSRERLKPEVVLAVEIPLPPLSEQERLVRVLRERLDAVARARRAAEEQLAAARALPAAYLRAVFNSPEAKEWPRKRLGEVAEVVNGFGFAEHLQGRTDLPYPFVKVSDMNAAGAETVISKAANTVDADILAKLGTRTYPAGTIIFPKVGGALLTNKKRMLGVEAAFDNNIMGVVPRTVESDWIFCWMQTVDLRAMANTQALPSIRQSDVAALEIPMPDLGVRKRVAAELSARLADVERLRRSLEEQLAAIEALPAALLRQAFRGEL